MREIGDSSSAGSTPPPPNLDNFSPSHFLVDDPLSPRPPTADDDLWKHLEDDGWCFFFDNNHHDSQQQFNVGRSAVSEPLRPKNASACRPPHPPRGFVSERRKRRQLRRERRDGTKASKHSGVGHQLCPPNHDQEWDNSIGNPSVVQSLASECDKDEMSMTESDEDEVQSDLPVNEKRHPEIGMEFSSEEEAYKFYKKHAEEVGFSVRKGKVIRLSNGTIRKRNFLCSKQGFKLRKISNKTMKYERKETRTGCNAYMQVTVEDGKWVISNFAHEHNHEFDKPRRKHVMGSFVNNIEVPASTKTTVDNVRLQQVDSVKYGLPNSRTFNILQPEDVQSLMCLFSDLQVKDPSFLYAIQVDSAKQMTSFFWRDCRSRMDYGYFGDVVVFDTTIRVDSMIYAPFWGLNHHQQRVLFGCALLLDESLEAFLWLFKVFVVAMDNCQPKTLYSTDESHLIAAAIEKVLPKTQHRLGVSHIYKNAKKHLSTYFDLPDFENLFNKCIFDCQSKQEFESQWGLLVTTFNLRENTWLSTLQSLWEKWSHLFNKKTFSAGIELLFSSPTPSINVNEIMSLPDFVQQYVKEAKKMRREELHEDLCCSKLLPVRSRKGMEKHAEDVYTRTVFKKFQDELLDSLSLAIEEVTSSGNISAFKLTEEGQKEDIVTFDCSSSTVTCSCSKFESIGILCGHCIKVLNAKNIFQIPSQYILKRWTKSAKEGGVVNQVDDSDKDHTTRTRQRRFSSYSRNIMHKALQIISKSVGIEESRKMVEDSLDSTLKRADGILKETGIEQSISSTSLEAEVNYEACCDIDSDVFVKNQKITSNSSCVNQVQVSERPKSIRKHGFTKTM